MFKTLFSNAFDKGIMDCQKTFSESVCKYVV